MRHRNVWLKTRNLIRSDNGDEEYEIVEDVDYETAELEDDLEPGDSGNENVAIFVNTGKGNKLLQYDKYEYRMTYNTKRGIRYVCVNKSAGCVGSVFLTQENEIVQGMMHNHGHQATSIATDDTNQADTALVLTSRKGKEMLLFRSYTYRKQYMKHNKCRWVCSTQKNCRACVFTDASNFITSAHEDHCHQPPKYYSCPENVLSAIRQPLTDTD